MQPSPVSSPSPSGSTASASAPAIPLSHGSPGSVEVEVERISPVDLVLRTAARWLEDGSSNLEGPGAEPKIAGAR